MNNNSEKRFIELLGEIQNIAVQGYDKNRRVIYWNKASEVIYGYTKAEAFGQLIEDLIIPDLLKNNIISSINNWQKTGIALNPEELHLIHKDGSTVYVYSSHVMLNQDTDNPELFCLDIDLSEQKKQEKLLKEKDKILQEQSKMASMGQMLENIAHQWRQPLSIISSTTSGIKIQKEFKNISDEYLIKSLDSIDTNVKYMSQTIDDFRDFIKGEHKKINFNILSMVNKSLKLLEGIVKKDYLDINFVSKEFDTTVTAYPNNIIQVVINIISNAKDAFIQNNIKDRHIFITLKKEKQNISIIIKDNAGGIPNNIINKIFEQNFTTKKECGGTGIGLSMSLRLMKDNMNGDIKVSNVEYNYKGKKEKGAEFIIILPI
jgi:PAS domain S-box-containing protein